MKMSHLSKVFVNSDRHADRNVKDMGELLGQVDLGGRHRALEVGCGGGKFSAYLSGEHHLSVTGIDVDPDQVRRAVEVNSENPDNEFLVADASDLPFEDASFEVIVSQKVLHHVSEWEKAVDEIGRVSSPGTLYFFDDFAFPKSVKPFARFLAGRYGIYDMDELEDRLSDRGFEIRFRKETKGLFFQQHRMVLEKAR